ncbi:MAG: site-specific integrase [Rhodospirillaceae bacterium]|nr:site-specific integrase [Rhodospirillaceae bacterium]MBT6428091.1 site-specific integrase [Rhodospirillaceae bacterium]
MHQQDTRTYENGAVTLYRRSDHKTPRWHCRIKLPNERRYVRKSTGEEDLDKAKTAAMTDYYVLLSKQQNKLPIFSKNFDDAAKAFLDEQIFRHSVGAISDGRLAYQKSVVGRWFTMYFEKRAIDRITTDDINEYWKWRINYWKSDEGTAELKITGRSVAMNPKSTTLNEEKISLKQVFDFAAEKGWISRNTLPIIKLPMKVKPESREHFTIEEWRSIALYMENRWSKTAMNAEKLFARKRVMTRVIVSRETGMRPPEATNLRWRDIGDYTDPETGEKYTEIFVHGKDKERSLIADLSVLRRLNEWKKISTYTKHDDYVFCTKDGGRAKFDNGIFTKMLREFGLLKDKRGENRTLYSLRHTFAADRILDGDVDYYLLAKAMGTSIRMIEMHYGHLEPKKMAAKLTHSKYAENLKRAWRSYDERKREEKQAPT